MKKEGDRRYAARPRERPVHLHPAEAVAVAVAEPVDGDDAREQKDIKTGSFLRRSPKPCVVNVDVGWPLDANANAPRPHIADPPNDEGVK